MSKEGKQRLVIFMAIAAATFLTTAVASVLIGAFLDERFDVSPFGTVGSMLVSYAVAWTILLQFRKVFIDKYVKTKKQEAKQQSKKQGGKK